MLDAILNLNWLKFKDIFYEQIQTDKRTFIDKLEFKIFLNDGQNINKNMWKSINKKNNTNILLKFVQIEF